MAGAYITYSELRAETLRIAGVIQQLGARSGDRVALLLHDSPEFIEAFIATCSLGAIAVPINMALRTDEQCSILHNSGANLAFMESDTCNALLTHAPEKLRSLKNIVSVEPVEEPENSGEVGDHFSITELQLRNPPLMIHDLTGLLDDTSRRPSDPSFRNRAETIRLSYSTPRAAPANRKARSTASQTSSTQTKLSVAKCCG